MAQVPILRNSQSRLTLHNRQPCAQAFLQWLKTHSDSYKHPSQTQVCISGFQKHSPASRWPLVTYQVLLRSLGLHDTAEILLSVRKYLGWNNPSGSLIKKKGNVPFKAEIALLKRGQIIYGLQRPFHAGGIIIAHFPCTPWTLFSLKFYYIFKYTLLVLPSARTYDRLKGSIYRVNCWTHISMN